ncbi:bifunctional hydroxymethylpyrimidine kinase/phosphomethylpyrimidine kinase [Alkalilimnicola sp. S0819]|uniref:bifunctional hydroxymethylpyrimidine kinase/phosphomethylpyrimidine kinase n=1 Tax=Alkalilimnicola sp. S0819 TaxID=2613922 RepID=UPI001261955A|nr:bifunctional hydroxymethylpyrimidine kinase/phosphomethylpyrimidine kinase [Alkalilimnicola sp. S0819]KAB7619502.1 bifunctional hydroxymethylpyrimidine kinase/phosphomethylpyrimidine kinase [Alkalilimnicola sp. S0819]MPQ17680.1 bifunctional hydroxymethylpyrimidine kinase/phosphomethylpyrimidine kinase [Alkalilimnicola sp. S0819]
MQGRVLVIAGSDSGGGAGIQADTKAITALGGHAATAITALTAQNTLGVQGVHGVPVAFIREQMRVVLEDIGADCIKTGMLHNAEVVEAVAAALAEFAPEIPLVLDPVMVAQGGASLLHEEAVAALHELLLPRAALITPNLPEAEALLGQPIADAGAMPEAARALAALTPGAVLLKGGHLPGDELRDVLLADGELHSFHQQRLHTRAIHGTGCTLASAIAAGLAQGLALKPAVERSRAYLRAAMEHAPGLGQGHGPVGHGFCCVYPHQGKR